MEEPVRKNVLNYLENKDNPICQLIIINKIDNSSFDYLSNYLNNYKNKITGLFIVYKTCMVLLIEAEEITVFQVCLDLSKSATTYFENARLLSIDISKNKKLLNDFICKKIINTSFDDEKIICDETHYVNVAKKFNEFYGMCENNDSSKNDNLANIFNDLENTIEILVNDSRGYNLSDMIKKYWKCFEHIEVDIWPVSQNIPIKF